MRAIDLHTHSIYSDGAYSPSELVCYAKSKKLAAISLTDHDTVDGLDEAQVQSRESGLRFINGVEIKALANVCNKTITIHILGYLFDLDKIRPSIAKLRVTRDVRNRMTIATLRSLGIDISYIEVKKHAGRNIVTSKHFAKALVEKGYAKTVNEAITKYLTNGDAANIDYSARPYSEIIKMIHDAGGVATLAHPIHYNLNNYEMACLIKMLVDGGLDAIECIHSSQDLTFTLEMLRFAEQYNLAVTGGSDFHGNINDGIDLGIGRGDLFIPESLLNEFIVR